MPLHRLILGASVPAVAMALLTISMAAAQDPPQSAGTTGAQDPFQVAEKSADTAADKKAKKKAEPPPEFVRKSEAEWQRILPRGVFMVTRLKATEPAWTGKYATGHFHGTFVCACCGAELFSSETKFESGTGWPSFWQPIAEKATDRAVDHLEAEPRMEVMCHRCGAHLGHVFDDGPPPTGLRFCINSLSLKLKHPDGTDAVTPPAKSRANAKLKTSPKTKTKNAMLTTRTKGTAKTATPDTPGSASPKPSGSETPSAGKTGGF
jgi:peptide-methionine (R)-S-oxide reductase